LAYLKRLSTQLLLSGVEVRSYEDVVGIYRDRLRRLGPVSESLLYRSREQHDRKLCQIAQLLGARLTRDNSVLDVGCGFGGLVDHLPECQYKGIDLVTEFIEEARSRHPGKLFEVRSLASEGRRYDWCVMACLLNGVPEPEEVFLKSWGVSRVGVCFDLIEADKVSPDFHDLHRFDTRATRVRLRELGEVDCRAAGSWGLFLIWRPPLPYTRIQE